MTRPAGDGPRSNNAMSLVVVVVDVGVGVGAGAGDGPHVTGYRRRRRRRRRRSIGGADRRNVCPRVDPDLGPCRFQVQRAARRLYLFFFHPILEVGPFSLDLNALATRKVGERFVIIARWFHRGGQAWIEFFLAEFFGRNR